MSDVDEVINNPKAFPQLALKSDTSSLNSFLNSTWGKMLKDLELNEPDSRAAKEFRQRHRVPYAVYLTLLQICEDYNIFDHDDGDSSIPVSIKLLAVLRMLARDTSADCIEEVTDIDRAIVKQFFRKFITNMSTRVYRELYAPKKLGVLNTKFRFLQNRLEHLRHHPVDGDEFLTAVMKTCSILNYMTLLKK